MANSNKKVLVVEDDEDFIWLLKQGFTGKNFSVVFAKDGEEGLKMAEEEKPDLILLDIVLPKMDGIVMAKKLKEKGFSSQIIFLTNLMGELPVAEGIVKETDYIVKSNMHINQIVAMVMDRLGIE
jgi:two-component system alkaline phosphatase synthesis response regulator PhoP